MYLSGRCGKALRRNFHNINIAEGEDEKYNTRKGAILDYIATNAEQMKAELIPDEWKSDHNPILAKLNTDKIE